MTEHAPRASRSPTRSPRGRASAPAPGAAASSPSRSAAARSATSTATTPRTSSSRRTLGRALRAGPGRPPPGVPRQAGPGRPPHRGRGRRARRDRAAAAELRARRDAPRRARRRLTSLRPRARGCLASRLRASSRSSARRNSSAGSAVSCGATAHANVARTEGMPSGLGASAMAASRASTIRCTAAPAAPGDDRELVAADARQAVAVADDLHAGVGHGAQDGVAGRMAELVVDRLEVVEVEEHQRGRAPSAVARASASSKLRRLNSPVSGSRSAMPRWTASAWSRRCLR